jgi:hypothetical protein
MAGFIRRFNVFPPIEVLTEIEAIDIIDLAPPSPTTGIGTGTLYCVGEFEDGAFATGGDSPYWNGFPGNNEVFSSQDLLNKYGGFGFTYGTEKHRNPCSRKHGQELWNGNGFIKLKFCRPRRLLIGRVDTSVGQVAFSPLASILAGVQGPYALADGDSFNIVTDSGGPLPTPPVLASTANILGGAFAASGFVGGETITISVDDGANVPIIFSGADQSPGDVASKINATLGYAAAQDSGGSLEITGIVSGLSGKLVIEETTPGALAAIGLAAITVPGAGNVQNVDAVTAAEIATLINTDAALFGIGAAAQDQNGTLKIYSFVPGTGQIQVGPGGPGSMQEKLGFTLEPSAASTHSGGVIPAGTRVRSIAPIIEYVTMQTLTIPEGDAGPFTVKIRPAQDDGSVVDVLPAGAIQTVVDQPAFSQLSVVSQTTTQAAKTEPQMDVAYEEVFDTSLALTQITREANFSISARRSDAVMRKGVDNAVKASNCGNRGRKFIGRAPLGLTLQQARQDVALWRNERLFYTYPGWNVRIPEIAEVGATAGGEGFTDDGVITVGGDFPLATVDCRLPPEDNPGQATALIENFFQVEEVGLNFGIEEYIALKAAGICAPRRDRVSGSIYQSGITSSLTPGLLTQARRKMADFIQDSLAERMVPFSKKLGTEARKDSIRAIVEQFLEELKSSQNPEIARIADFSVDARSGNTPETEARGIFVLIIRVRTLSSLDAIVLQTEIGESVVTVVEAA